MADRDWMLNPTAIKAAKACISAVQDELDIKLQLSHPDFMDLLFEYAELTNSEPLTDALAALAPIAGQAHRLNGAASKPQRKKVVGLFGQLAGERVKPAISISQASAVETIEYRGKCYARFLDGKEFRGLYRGQPTYS